MTTPIEISLTRFVDFVTKTGSPKITSVRDTKRQLEDGYHPAKDYYKTFRDAVVRMFKDGETVDSLSVVVSAAPDHKSANYAILADGMKKFVGTKQKFSWFEPPADVWHHSPLSIKVNPELGLRCKADNLVVKMYWKEEAPKANEIQTILHLMRLSLGPVSTTGVSYCVLDVRRGKIFRERSFDDQLTSLLKGESGCFSAIYEGISP